MSWTDEMKAFATEKWLDGWSTSQVALALNRQNPGAGISRNAVIGMLHRAGIKRGQVSAPPPRATKVKPKPRAPRVVRVKELASSTALTMPASMVTDAPLRLVGGGRAWPEPKTAVALLDLKSSSCRFPVGIATGADQRFCGSVKAEGDSYCAGCRARMRPKTPARPAPVLNRKLGAWT
jgi:GcrA cell cycle regulator